MHSFWTTRSLNTPEDLNPQMLDNFIELFQLLSNMMADSCRLRKSISIFILQTDFTNKHVHMNQSRGSPSYISE
jgi:hypothetical protein